MSAASRSKSRSVVEKLMRAEPLDFVQFNYSIAQRTAEERLLPLAALAASGELPGPAFWKSRLGDLNL